jgi:fatty acid desaturase
MKKIYLLFALFASAYAPFDLTKIKHDEHHTHSTQDGRKIHLIQEKNIGTHNYRDYKLPGFIGRASQFSKEDFLAEVKRQYLRAVRDCANSNLAQTSDSIEDISKILTAKAEMANNLSTLVSSQVMDEMKFIYFQDENDYLVVVPNISDDYFNCIKQILPVFLYIF